MTERRRPIALITGATSGIGLEMAKRMAVDHQLVLTGRRQAHECAADLPPDAHYIKADLSDPVRSARHLAAKFFSLEPGRLDLLIINAGIGFHTSAGREDVAMVRQTLDVNLVSSIMLVRQFAPLLEASHGKVVFIGSVAHRGAANMPTYAASKAGLAGLARSLKSEWKDRIGVQIIHPGPTRTTMHAKAGYDPGILRKLFFSPEAMADEIVRRIKDDRTHTRISIKARLGRFILRRRP
tara:strand:- start:899 stop:1615 length:717 start_codon:yes stop_codon:yes gene_type:complete